MNEYNFGPAAAGEAWVYGARRPRPGDVADWIASMGREGIAGVLCLLPEEEMAVYANPGLLDTYRAAFGAENVCGEPIPDFHLATREQLRRRILPFLRAAVRDRRRVVVHCHGGNGRTGQVLAAWLVAGRGMSVAEAIAAVRAAGRNPHEAEERGTAPAGALEALLRACVTRGEAQPACHGESRG